MSAITVTDLTKRYASNGPAAVDGLSLTVEPGSIFGFLGPNGAGKTTTIKILTGLLSATSGTARIDGLDVARDRAGAMSRLGAVLEGSRNVYWTLSAWQNLVYFGRLKGLRRAAAGARAERLLTEIGLWDRRGEQVGTFSRGMQQQVAIAAALIADPAVLLLDEPTLGLDVAATRAVKDRLRALARDEGKTILLTTHQLDVVEELCDRVAVINRGRAVADLPTRELLAQSRSRDHYELRIDGDADLPLPEGFTAERGENETVVSGRADDPETLYRLIDALRAQGRRLHSVDQVRPSLETVFLTLVAEPAHA
ncbi:daunorubicin resistance protein DrrA family ABC transporter ATP-binding protein [Glycomyces scopariae]